MNVSAAQKCDASPIIRTSLVRQAGAVSPARRERQSPGQVPARRRSSGAGQKESRHGGGFVGFGKEQGYSGLRGAFDVLFIAYPM
ncbi:hypothetical protein ISP15_07400 [Dyella jejuensis]|uniref:Uncharacterized protein n=1 Tax=Dyella jejuensis TaxID=1432009 RepID=A0ABW8JJX4_9GAMM